MSRVDLSGALMHISDAKTFSPSIKKKKGKGSKKTALGYIKGGNGEREKSEREFTVMTVHLFTLAAELISAFEW